ncbi:MAG TPA: DUF3011 domain-containing protein [Thermoanaerobaculia bacterium]|nr:DUF3011 domain-containing protein [Thermoanaerobaculia bacterium]
MRKPLLLLALLLFCASAQAQTVSCESLGYMGGSQEAYRECRVGTQGVVRMVMEVSDRLCFEGITWGTRSPGVVWVRRGCRATFTVGGPMVTKARAPVICESHNGKYAVCDADTVDGVVLSQQLSKTDCVRGRTWGWDEDRDLIWVDQGCRGAFLLGPPPATIKPAPSLDGKVICQSENGKRKECKADTAAGVQIIRTLNDKPCGFGREWGYDENGVWVKKNCQAEFAVRGKQKAMARTIECESKHGARSHCPEETQFGVAIVKQLGIGACVLGETWGFDETGVWVADNCHAQFVLGGYRLPVDKVPETAARLTCESIDGGHKQCPADTSRGVGLIQQISGADCVLNRSWGYDRNGIWVTNGCRAEFAVAR